MIFVDRKGANTPRDYSPNPKQPNSPAQKAVAV